MNDWILGRGWLALGVGVTSLVSLGILQIPGASLATLALFAGWDGGLDYFAGRTSETGKEIWRPMVIEGILDWAFVAVAFVALISPLVLPGHVVAGWLVSNGVLTLLASQKDRRFLRKPAFFTAGGLISLLGGSFLFARPLGDPALHWVFCGILILFGASQLLTTGILSKRAEREPAYP